MTYTKNGIIDEEYRWKNAIIPFYIEESHFTDNGIKTILSAMKEFHKKSCIRFKPYQSDDPNWVIVTGNETGCWSAVGMKGEGGQQLNVNSPKCVRKGVVIHELLHAAGFWHQQSSSDRDEFVKIIWENILDGHERNFYKYEDTEETNFGVSYDYNSIMHYSRYAFSKDGSDTIEPLQNATGLGQRDGFSKKDLIKLNKMYEASCNQPEDPKGNEIYITIIEWFRSLFI